MTDVDKLIDFLQELNDFKFVKRRTMIKIPEADKEWYENDAEHTWHMAMFAMMIHPHLSKEVDLLQTLKIILVHDLVEIYEGDVSAFDEAGRVGKEQREIDAANKLYGLLPEVEEKEMHALWQEYENQQTPESQFAKACDRLQAIAQGVIVDGVAWIEHRVTEERNRAYSESAMAFDPILAKIFNRLFEIARENGSFKRHGLE